jgi:hypothetical protein
MSLLQIFQPAEISGQTYDSVVTINPAHVRAVRMNASENRATACFVYSETHVEYVHFPKHNYSQILEMIREAFK